MNKIWEIFAFSMVLVLLVAISAPVDAVGVVRTTYISPKIPTGSTNDVFKNYQLGRSYDYGGLSLSQRSLINKLAIGQIDLTKIKYIELDQHLKGSVDRPTVLSHMDDKLVITSVSDENKERYWELIEHFDFVPERRPSPSPTLPSDGGPGGPPTHELTELMWYTPTLNKYLINKTTINQAKLMGLESNILNDSLIIRAVVSPTPTLTPTVTPMSTPTPTPPGFEAVIAFAGLLAVAYLIKRKAK